MKLLNEDGLEGRTFFLHTHHLKNDWIFWGASPASRWEMEFHKYDYVRRGERYSLDNKWVDYSSCRHEIIFHKMKAQRFLALTPPNPQNQTSDFHFKFNFFLFTNVLCVFVFLFIFFIYPLLNINFSVMLYN